MGIRQGRGVGIEIFHLARDKMGILLRRWGPERNNPTSKKITYFRWHRLLTNGSEEVWVANVKITRTEKIGAKKKAERFEKLIRGWAALNSGGAGGGSGLSGERE